MDIVFSRIKKIPGNRFGLECSLCSSRHGVPIECSARGCKAAYHTTCAIRGKLKMQAIFGQNYKGGLRLRSYCKEHSPSVRLENRSSSQSDTIDANGVREIDMTNLADDRLQGNNEELDYFWKYVDINEVHKRISEAYTRGKQMDTKSSIDCYKESSPKKNKKSPVKGELKKTNNSPKNKTTSPITTRDDLKLTTDVDPLVIDLIYRYWMLLRTANNGQSLIKFSPSALREKECEQRKSILRLRIELERVRNLSYMIGKREKLKASWLKTHQNIIKRTMSIIDELSPVTDAEQMIDHPQSPDVDSVSNRNNHYHQHHTHNHISTINYHQNSHNNTHQHHQTSTSKKSLHQTQHLQPTTGMFDESDQLFNDLLTCDQIYELPNSSSNSNSNYNNLTYQERCTLEGRRTLSLVRRINRQLKNTSHDASTLNPYAKSYLVSKRSDSPIGSSTTTTSAYNQQSANKILKFR